MRTMDTRIGKVKLNCDFYSGTDTYSDGDIENRLLDIVKSGKDLEEVLIEDTDWPVLYHLSDIRKNIVSWYDFNSKGTVLEIGSGCGAITGALCEKTSRVVAVDLSKRRSEINAYRNNYDNLEIIVGNFEDIKTDETFDYVTLIGVLEYSIYYINSPEPFLDMLRKAREYLKPGGQLIIAIENKYGLKYWAGAKEDHTGVEFDGIQNYSGVDRVRTFSRGTLDRLLCEAGFKDNDFYYPFPDYKLPLEIYSPEHLPGTGELLSYSPAYDRDRVVLFDEAKAAEALVQDGLFEEFANSFLVISRRAD